MPQDSIETRPSSLPVRGFRRIQTRLDVLSGLTSATIVAAVGLICVLGAPLTLMGSAAAAAAIGLIGVLAVTVFTIAVARTVARPIRALARTARDMAGGNLAARAPVTTADEVGVLATVFNRMAEDIQRSQEALLRQERLAALGQLTAMVSHELRNPLGMIRTSFFMLAGQLRGREPEWTAILDRIERSILRCDAIISDLLDYSRLRAIDRKSTDLDAWLTVVLREHELPEQVAIDLDLNCGVRLDIDRERFYQCISNVVANACQAMEPGGGRLSVASRCEDGRVAIRVADTGCGIPAGQLPRVFEPFYSTKSFGVGLGLPIVKQIVEQHGGQIEVHSQQGEGTTATIWLPLPEC